MYIQQRDIQRFYNELDLINRHKTGGVPLMESALRQARSIGLPLQLIDKLQSEDIEDQILLEQELDKIEENQHDSISSNSIRKNKQEYNREYYFDESKGESVQEHLGRYI